MATNCRSTAASRLSDLLREQQEPFLLLQDHDDDSATPARTPAAARRSLLRGSTAATVTKLALRWADDLLAGCFPCAATRQKFRHLPRADHGDVVAPADRHDGAAGECCIRQQLSPVSVLDLHSDDDSSPVPSHRNEHSDDDGNGKPSTSGSATGTSAPSIHDHDPDLPGKIPAMEERFQRTNVAFASAWDWESVAVDISRIPSLVELDLSGSPRDDRRRRLVVGGEEEAWQVAQSIEAMIFEEVRWEAVRDMLCSPQH